MRRVVVVGPVRGEDLVGLPAKQEVAVLEETDELLPRRRIAIPLPKPATRGFRATPSCAALPWSTALP